MKVIDQTKIYDQYKGKWVILDESRTKVLASSDKLNSAIKKYQKQYGTEKIPLIFKVPTEIMPYIGY